MDKPDVDVVILVVLGVIAAICGVAGVLIHDRMKDRFEEDLNKLKPSTGRGLLEDSDDEWQELADLFDPPDELEPPDN